MIIEIVQFHIKNNITEESLKSISSNFEAELKKVDGFIERKLTKNFNEPGWIEIIWWSSIDAANLALNTVTKTREFELYCAALIDDGGDNITYWESVRS